MFFEPISSGGEDLINDYKNADNVGLQQFFTNFLTEEFEGINTEEAWDLFKSILEIVSDKFIPKNRRNKGGNQSWMTKNIKRRCKKNQDLWIKYSKSREESDFRNFKELEKNSKRHMEILQLTFTKSYFTTI